MGVNGRQIRWINRKRQDIKNSHWDSEFQSPITIITEHCLTAITFSMAECSLTPHWHLTETAGEAPHWQTPKVCPGMV
jgi:hypothetical protein